MTELMKGIVFTAPQKVEIMEFQKPTIKDNEVLIKTKAFAICTMEQRLFRNSDNYPQCAGHEVCGVIEQVGADVFGYNVGDKVVSTFSYCGYCENCKRGRGSKCVNTRLQRKRADGHATNGTFVTIGNSGMIQYAAVPATQICKVGDNVPVELACLSEPLACCLHSVSKTRAEFGDTCVIIGAGIMGILHTKLFRMKGCRVIVSEMDPVRREKALAAGANIVIDPSSCDAVEEVKKYTDGLGADIVVNTTSIYQVGEQALQMLAVYGRLIAYASLHPAKPLELNFGEVHYKEIEIIGTVSPRAEDFVYATKLMKYGLIDMSDVLEQTWPMEEAQQAFERAIAPDSYRCVVVYD